jgi:hypothetical protein
MTDSYEVVTAELTAHSISVIKLSDDLRSTMELAGGQSITGDAYGQTGRQFAAMLDALASAGRETLRLAVECLETEAAKVRASAAEFDRQEADVTDALGSAGSGLR